MPELPDLEIVSKSLARNVIGATIASAEVLRPIVVRNLLGGDLVTHLAGRTFVDIQRRGKFLLFSLDNGSVLVVHPMLAGRMRYGTPLARNRKRDVLVLSLTNGDELRYHDAKDMGKVYLCARTDDVPGFSALGPDATDPALSEDVFRKRLRRQRGEIKRVLTTQSFVAGIGNAYADEILWRAGLYPFRHRSTLTDNDVAQLYRAMRGVLCEAINVLQQHTTGTDEVELRDFMEVHGKDGQPCPRCGSSISKVTRARRATNFCRTCQPGLLVGG